MLDEMLDAAIRLKNLGCPYDVNDSRAIAWVKGYDIGFKEATSKAIDALHRKTSHE